MGNQYHLRHQNNIQQTHFTIESMQTQQFTGLVHTTHKTISEFFEDNQDFFQNQAVAIKDVLLSYTQFEQHLNKFPIQRSIKNKKVFLPNLIEEQFFSYKGQCIFLDFKNYEFYLGEVNCGQKQGFGMMINKNGNKYQGNWVDNIQNGQGSLEIMYPKRLYQGNWENGKLNGKGEVVYEDGAKYQGNFQQGKKNGMGILTFYDGTVYQGYFENDLMHGYGTLTSIKGKQISGQWKNGKYQASRPDRSSKTFSINQLPAI